MQLLISGGTHVLQGSVADALIAESHQVRIVRCGARQPSSRHGAQGAPVMVHGDSAAALASAVRGCDAVVVIDSSVAAADAATAGSCPGTPQIIGAAAEAHVPRLVAVCSAAAAPAIEDALRGAVPHWLVLRSTGIYGTGNDPVTRSLIMMRSLPAVPVIGDQHVLRPVWHEDLAAAIASSLTLEDAALSRAIDIAGPDAVTQAELYDRISALTDRRPVRIPIPEFLATYGLPVARALGLSAPLDATSFEAGDATPQQGSLAASLEEMFGVRSTSLAEGLRRLVLELDEVTPGEGVGSVQLKHFRADIARASYSAPALLDAFRHRFADLMPSPVGVEPAAPAVHLMPGAVVTIALPGRGHVQARVEEVEADRVVLATLRGHALAGFVRFTSTQIGEMIRFEVTTCDAAANALDWVTLTLGGAKMQDANWTRVVENVVALSGGHTNGVETDVRTLSSSEAEALDRWAARLVSTSRGERPSARA